MRGEGTAGPSGTWLEAYAAGPFERIGGWVLAGALELLAAIDRIQREWDVQGGVVEIGVYQGRFFIALNGLIDDPAIPSLAIDLFEHQDLNIDASGRGDKDIFLANLDEFDRHQGRNVVLLSADSTRLTAAAVLEHLRSRPRLFSIDGGHTPEHTIADLHLASQVVGSHGIILLDDILNAHWLGVAEGTVLFLAARPVIWPLAIGHNKLLLCPMSVHGRYRARLAELLPFRKTVSLCGYEVLAI